MSSEKAYWFPARREGIGWGFPQTWQGVVTLALYVASIPVFFGLPKYFGHTEAFHWGIALATLIFLGVCRWKGEPLP